MNSPHKGPVTRNMFTFDDVIMIARRAMLYTILNMNYDKTFFRHVMKIYTHYSKEGHKLAKWFSLTKIVIFDNHKYVYMNLYNVHLIRNDLPMLACEIKRRFFCSTSVNIVCRLEITGTRRQALQLLASVFKYHVNTCCIITKI